MSEKVCALLFEFNLHLFTKPVYGMFGTSNHKQFRTPFFDSQSGFLARVRTTEATKVKIGTGYLV